jgi:hypothetical protein
MQPSAVALIAWPYVDHYTASAEHVPMPYLRDDLQLLTPHGLVRCPLIEVCRDQLPDTETPAALTGVFLRHWLFRTKRTTATKAGFW